jgi:hypothetical protein
MRPKSPREKHPGFDLRPLRVLGGLKFAAIAMHHFLDVRTTISFFKAQVIILVSCWLCSQKL